MDAVTINDFGRRLRAICDADQYHLLDALIRSKLTDGGDYWLMEPDDLIQYDDWLADSRAETRGIRICAYRGKIIRPSTVFGHGEGI